MTAAPVCVYAYPWDVNGDPAAIGRLHEIGASSVGLAVNYHSVRAATPAHPEHRLIDAQHAALYVTRDEALWADSPMRPASAEAWAGPDSAGRARAGLRAAGFATRAWLVVTHNSLLGTRHPESCVQDAFGAVHRHALCPNDPGVREFARRLAVQAARSMPGDAIVLEAAGPLGVEHLGQHEKTAGADWSQGQRDLLSICFCRACRADYALAGLAVDELRAQVRLLVDDDGPSGSAAVGPDALGEAAEVVLAVRRRATTTLIQDAAAAARREGSGAIAVHVDDRRWGTGAHAAVALEPLAVDLDVLPGRAFGAPRVPDASGAAGAPTLSLRPVAATVSGLPGGFEDVDGLRHRIDELHAYHLGLLSAERWSALANSVRGIERAPVDLT